jgi:hypothetical protein
LNNTPEKLKYIWKLKYIQIVFSKHTKLKNFSISFAQGIQIKQINGRVATDQQELKVQVFAHF